MDKRRITAIAVAGAILLVAVVLGILYFSSISKSTAKVELPDTGNQGEVNENDFMGHTVSVNQETVSDVVAVMARPENYHMQVSIAMGGGSSAVFAVGDMWAAEGKSLVAVTQPDGAIKNTITSGDMAYIWYSDDITRIYEGAAGDFTGDDAMMIYTYETVVTAEPEDIKYAGYETACGESCIYVVLEKDGVETELWVSAAKGILLQAQRHVDGEQVYSMTTVLLETDTVSENIFTLPDGRLV